EGSFVRRRSVSDGERSDRPNAPFVIGSRLGYDRPASFGQPTGEETPAMRTSFSVNDMTIHRIVEQESGFTPMLDFLPTLSKETLEENLTWLAPGGYDGASG